MLLLITEMLCSKHKIAFILRVLSLQKHFLILQFLPVRFFTENASVSLSFWPKIAWVFSDLEFFLVWVFSKTLKKKACINHDCTISCFSKVKSKIFSNSHQSRYIYAVKREACDQYLTIRNRLFCLCFSSRATRFLAQIPKTTMQLLRNIMHIILAYST